MNKEMLSDYIDLKTKEINLSIDMLIKGKALTSADMYELINIRDGIDILHNLLKDLLNES